MKFENQTANQAGTPLNEQNLNKLLAWEKVHNPGSEYHENDVVSHNGIAYRCKADTPSNTQTQISNTTYWERFGTDGPQGPQGSPGVTPNITPVINTLQAGSNATVTKTGTNENPTLTFGIPKGDTGVAGPIGPQGPIGPKGDKPSHTWSGTNLQFENSNGTPGNSVNLKGEKGNKPAHTWNGTSLIFENPDGTPGSSVNLKGEQGEKGDLGFFRMEMRNGDLWLVTPNETSPLHINQNGELILIV